MKEVLTIPLPMTEQDRLLEQTMNKERRKLLDFIRRRIPEGTDPEDILQDVFYELTANVRMSHAIDQVSAWLFRVARNKIADLFRRKRTESLEDQFSRSDEDGEETLGLGDLLPDQDAGPELKYVRQMLMEEIEAALDELPEEQREVFWQHEIEGRSFKEISDETGISVNTLLSRKHYAVIFLRKRLRDIYNDMFNN
jgi:RNA polymerase sigma factor (sigma-70 family)